MAQSSIFALAATLLLSTGAASAQTTFRLGVRGGLNRALTTVDPAGNNPSYPVQYTTDKTPIYAWQAGAVFEVKFDKFALQPAVVFSQKGERAATLLIFDGFVRTVNERASTVRTNWLELPLNMVYTLHGDHGLQLFAGPYVALAVGGHQTTSSKYNYISTNDIDTQLFYGPGTYNRRLDAGFNIGVGYRQGPLQVQLGYGLGLRNLHQDGSGGVVDFIHDFSSDAAYSRVAQLTGTYFFTL